MADFLADLDPGDLATWATALVALLALVAAAWAGWTSHRLLKVEQKREDRAEQREEERRREAERVAQADLVSWWPSLPPHVHLLVRNSSPLPIYDVGFMLQRRGTPQASSTEMLVVMPPQHDHSFEYPNDVWTPAEDDGLGNFEEGQVELDLDDFDIFLAFVDTAGRIWHRHADGFLERKLNLEQRRPSKR